jgi:hypothetical protein
MIIGFCGRLRSGKSELSKVCQKHGYQPLSFAIPLKELCADILDTSIDKLNRAKNENIPIEITINDDICTIIAQETNIPINIVNELANGKYIHTVRDLLQFVGTDIIRTYNKDWHVNRLKEMINNETNYVFDDVRFQNEKKMIEELGGHTWFVVRPTLENISNHESENSIIWQHCYNKVIINDSSLNNILFKWDLFMENYEESCRLRDEEFKAILENKRDWKSNPLSKLDLIFLPKHLFTYVPKEYNKNDIEKITMNEDKSIFIKYKDETIEMVENPLEIEDIKQLL